MAPGKYRRPKAELQLTGIKELDKKLKKLIDRDAKRIMRNAIRSGLRVGAKQLKDDVPVGKTKKLKKAVGHSLKRDKKLKATVGKWGINVGAKKGKAARHGPSLMTGTKERFHKDGKGVGRIVLTGNVVQESYSKSSAAVHSTIIAKVREGLEKMK